MIRGLLLGKFLMQYNKLNKTTKCFPCWLTKKCVSVYSQHLNIWLANAYVKWHTTRHTKNLSMSVMNRDHYRLANLYFRLLKGRRLLIKKNLYFAFRPAVMQLIHYIYSKSPFCATFRNISKAFKFATIQWFWKWMPYTNFSIPIKNSISGYKPKVRNLKWKFFPF